MSNNNGRWWYVVELLGFKWRYRDRTNGVARASPAGAGRGLAWPKTPCSAEAL
jgi:hypothetical protein